MTTTFIATASGLEFHFDEPKPEMICIEDIAHALSNLCRYNGHCERYFSVAEHCILLSEAYVWGNEEAFALLMHDAAEAYICDLPRPIKYALPSYQTIEARIERAIANKFGLQYPHSPLVKEWDARAILDERAQAMSQSKSDWNLGGLQPLGIKLNFWDPPTAEKRFLDNFHRLYALCRKDQGNADQRL